MRLVEILKTAVAVLCLGVVAGCAPALTPGELEKSEWPTFLRDDLRTNTADHAPGLPLEKSWREAVDPFTIINVYPKEQLSQPVVSAGVLYVASTNGKLYAFELGTGKTLWKHKAGVPLEAPPTVGDTKVCFGSSDGKMKCLDKGTGAELWSYQAKSEILSAPVLSEGMLFFSSSDDKVHALDPDSGEKLWVYSRRSFKTVTPRVYASSAAAGGFLFHQFGDGTLVCLKADTGVEAWAFDAVEDFSIPDTRRTPLVYGDRVYVIGEGGSVVALDSSTGDIEKTFDVIEARDFVLSGERTLVVAGPEMVVSLDAATGAIRWKTGLGERSPVTSILASGDVLFVLTTYTKVPFGIDYFARKKAMVVALDMGSGEELWSRKLDSTVSARTISANSRFVVFENSGEVQVYAPDTP